MPTLSDVREGVCATADTYQKLTTQLGSSAVQDSVVPSWARSIREVSIGAGVDGAAAAGTIHVGFEGATTHGRQRIAMLGHGNIGTTVGIAGADCVRKVGFGVNPGGALEVSACFAGGDSGSPEAVVGWTYSSMPPTHQYITRQAAITTADAFTTMNTEDGTTAIADTLALGSHIDQVMTVAGFGSTTQEPQQAFVRLRGVGGSLEGNEHSFPCPSYVVSDGTLADCYINGTNVFETDIECHPGTIIIEGASSGATVTTDPEVACTIAFRLGTPAPKRRLG